MPPTLSPDLKWTMLCASLRVSQDEWCQQIRNIYGDEAAHWFAQGMGVAFGLSDQFDSEWQKYVEGEDG